jgi:hypothetical protein
MSPLVGSMATAARDRLAPIELDRVLADTLHRAALCIDEQLLDAGATVQFLFIRLLDTALARQRRARVLVEIQRFLVFLADGADIADGMDAARAERVVARQARPDFDARKLIAAGGEARELLVRQLQLHRHGLETAAAANVLLQAREVGVVEQAELRQAQQSGIYVGNLLTCQLQLVRGCVGRERQAVAIEDQPAVRRDWLDLDAVTL